MGIDNSYDGDTSDKFPVQTAVILCWWRFLRRFEDETVRTIQINRKLASPIALQLVTSPRQRAHHVEIRYGTQVIEPSTD
jgi:hypothetical protein